MPTCGAWHPRPCAATLVSSCGLSQRAGTQASDPAHMLQTINITQLHWQCDIYSVICGSLLQTMENMIAVHTLKHEHSQWDVWCRQCVHAWCQWCLEPALHQSHHQPWQADGTCLQIFNNEKWGKAHVYSSLELCISVLGRFVSTKNIRTQL
jgi:hypothetical protein